MQLPPLQLGQSSLTLPKPTTHPNSSPLLSSPFLSSPFLFSPPSSPLRPTQINFTELYELDGCSSFVADFLAMERLEDPLHPPEFLPSPMSCLGWQVGERERGRVKNMKDVKGE
jgi:hypothetical protein